MLRSRRDTHPNPAKLHGSSRLHTDRSRSVSMSVSSMTGACIHSECVLMPYTITQLKALSIKSCGASCNGSATH